MRRMLLVAVAAVGALLIAVPASAAYWAWLEQFSGPGPLRARKPPFLSTVCVQDGGFQPSPIARSDKLHQRLDAAAKALAAVTTARWTLHWRTNGCWPTPARPTLSFFPTGASLIS